MHIQRLNTVLFVCLTSVSAAYVWVREQPVAAQVQPQSRPPDVPYVPTSPEVVDEMLRIANVTREDVLYDLGSGDGRIVIAAAQKFGTRGIGVDINPKRISEAQANAEQAGVTDRVQFLQQDLFETDIRDATVVTLYLLPKINLKLRPILLRDLKPGTRVVSHEFDMGDWRADRAVQTAGGNNIYFWVIPAQVAGTWTWNSADAGDSQPYELHLTQHFQQVSGVLKANGVEMPIANAKLIGKQLDFLALQETAILTFSGQVNDNTITGHVETQGEMAKNQQPWVASRAVSQ
jgi:SAM-dependent methyltransferase